MILVNKNMRLIVSVLVLACSFFQPCQAMNYDKKKNKAACLETWDKAIKKTTDMISEIKAKLAGETDKGEKKALKRRIQEQRERMQMQKEAFDCCVASGLPASLSIYRDYL